MLEWTSGMNPTLLLTDIIEAKKSNSSAQSQTIEQIIV